MVKETPIIALDEPTGNLDEASAKDVLQILNKVAKGKLVILVTHNIEQVEEYATRIVKVHDGRIIENKVNKIRITSKYRLGIRNTFNILTKFLLLFVVFLFIISALFAEYAGFMQTERHLAEDGSSPVFHDLSENRILMKKQDKTYFTEEDYLKLENLDNTELIVKDDMFLDSTMSLSKDDIYVSGHIKSIETLNEQVDIGRRPENEKEVIWETFEDHFFITNKLNDLLTKEFEMQKRTLRIFILQKK